MNINNLWGDWEVNQFIGEGQFGKVYKIVREEFGYTYESALKVIQIPQNQSEVQMIKSEGLSNESVTEYYKSIVEDIVEEFALMSKLKGNSNIVSYEDHAVRKRENAYGWEILIRMELVTPLLKYLENNELTVRDVIKLGIDMCKALEICQKYNIIHRDIKPENIFVSDIGTFKLGDFGIARQLEKTSSELSKKGTYTYMAPEVYKGLSYNSNVDIYSLGIVLYRFMNNNRTPFMPPAPQQIRYSDKNKANAMRFSGQKIPKPCNAEGRLAEIILKACAYNPKDRYESPYAMRQELQAILYSSSEKNIAYPHGDILTNDKNEYAVNLTSDFTEEKIVKEKEDDFISDEEKTISLFGLDNKKDSDDINNTKKLERNNQGMAEELGDEAIFRFRSGMKHRNKEDDKEEMYADKSEGKTEEDVTGKVSGTTEKKVNKNAKGDKNKVIKTVSFGVLGAVTILFIVYFMSQNKQNKVQVDNHASPKVSEVVAETTFEEITEEEVSEVSNMLVVPDVKGKSLQEAQQVLRDLGFNYVVKTKYYNSVRKGKVISQSIKADKEVERGTTITITISKGKKGKGKKEEKTTVEQHTVKVVEPQTKKQVYPPETTKKSKDIETENWDDWELIN